MKIPIALSRWMLLFIYLLGLLPVVHASNSSTEEDVAHDSVRLDSFPTLRQKSNNFQDSKLKKESELLRTYSRVNESVTFREIVRYEDLHYNVKIQNQVNTLLKLESLVYLRIKGSFTKFPVELIQLGKLEQLNLEGSNFCVHRIIIERFGGLKRLSLKDCQLKGIKGLGDSSTLEEIDLSGNQLKKIPNGLDLLEKLISLNLNGNPLNRLKPRTKFSSRVALDNMALLEVSADGSDVSKKSESSGKSKALPIDLPRFLEGLSRQIFFLSLQARPSSYLPISIGQFGHLMHLNLSHMGLKELPTTFKWLKNLQFLDLSFNELGAYLHPLQKLVNLRTLDLSNNRLGSWPENYTTFVNLVELDLSNTEIDTLPNSFSKLYSLKVLKIMGNGFADGVPKCLEKLFDCKIYILESHWAMDIYNKKREERMALRGKEQAAQKARRLQSSKDSLMEDSSSQESSSPIRRPRKHSV